MRCLPALTAGCCLLAVSTLTADDWLRFRGPNGSGIAENADPPVEWSPTSNLKWKTELPGAGVSCPIVVGERIFLTCYSGYGLDRRDPGNQQDLKRHLVCLDRATGDINWTKTIDAVLPEDPYAGAGVPEHGYASHTPVSDGERVYAFFGKSGAFAFDLDGNQLWKTPLGTESDARRWGSSSSPILTGDIVVVSAGPESRSIVGLDKATGEEKWRAEAEGLGMVWGTPILSEVDGRTDIVLGAPYEIWGLNPDNGKLRWYAEVMATESFSSSVVQSGDLFVAIEGRGGGSVAVRAGGKGDVTEANRLWLGRDNNRFATPIAHEGLVYFVNSGIANCMEAATGEAIYRERLPAAAPSGGDSDRGGFGGRGRGGRSSDYASPVMANDRIYYQKRNGDLHVYKVGRDFEHLAVNRVTDNAEDFSATPAIADNELFIRSSKAIYCVASD